MARSTDVCNSFSPVSKPPLLADPFLPPRWARTRFAVFPVQQRSNLPCATEGEICFAFNLLASRHPLLLMLGILLGRYWIVDRFEKVWTLAFVTRYSGASRCHTKWEDVQTFEFKRSHVLRCASVKALLWSLVFLSPLQQYSSAWWLGCCK